MYHPDSDHIVWGDKTIALPDGARGDDEGSPVALLAPNLLLLRSGQAIDQTGNVVFTVPGWQAYRVNVNIVAGNGYIVYVNDLGRLVALKAPVTGMKEDAPWATPAGNAQGNHRAQ